MLKRKETGKGAQKLPDSKTGSVVLNVLGPITCDTLFSWAPKSLQMVIAARKLKDACSLEEKC